MEELPAATQQANTSDSSGAIPVIVFGGGTVTGGGVTRIFNESGIETFNAGKDPELSTHSKYYRLINGSDGLAPDAAELLSFLERLHLERAFLMPCSDDWVTAVIGLPESSRLRFPTCMPPPSAASALLDKWKFAQLLTQLNIPHPQTRLLQSEQELQSVNEDDLSHKFLKPMASLDFLRAYGVKALIVANKQDALERMKKVSFPIMLQEYVQGPPTAHYFIDGFIDRKGKCCAQFARQRIRMYPPFLGNSTSLVSVGLETVASAVESLQLLLRHVAYRGIFSAEFKYDANTGAFKILEVNARPWWYVEFAARAGVNVCLMAYRDALGLPVTPVTNYEVGRRCTYFWEDLSAFRYSRGQSGTSFWQWLKSIAGADEAIFRWSDPGVGAASASEFIARQWRKRIK